MSLAILDRLRGTNDKDTYVGAHRTERNEPQSYLLSPASYQLVTRTQEPVPAHADDATGLLRIRDIHPTNAFTTTTPVDTAHEGGEQ